MAVEDSELGPDFDFKTSATEAERDRLRAALRELVEASADIPELLESLDTAREPDDVDIPLTARFSEALRRAKEALR